jgi:hypothetical protein
MIGCSQRGTRGRQHSTVVHRDGLGQTAAGCEGRGTGSLRLRVTSCSRLFGSQLKIRVIRISDLHQREPCRRHHRELARAHRLAANIGRAIPVDSSAADRDTGAHERANHTVAESIRLQFRGDHPGAVPVPRKFLKLPDGGGSLTRATVRRPVVKANERLSRMIHAVDIQNTWIPNRVTAQKWIALGDCVCDPVFVPAPERGEARVKSRRRRAHPRDINVVVGPGDAVETTSESCCGLGAWCRAAVRLGEQVELVWTQVEVGHLSRGVHTGIRPARDGEKRQWRVPAEHRRESRLEFALDRTQVRLFRPPREGRTIVGNV